MNQILPLPFSLTNHNRIPLGHEQTFFYCYQLFRDTAVPDSLAITYHFPLQLPAVLSPKTGFQGILMTPWWVLDWLSCSRTADMCVTTRLTKTVELQVKFTFPDPKEAFSQPMYMSSGGTWTSWNLFAAGSIPVTMTPGKGPFVFPRGGRVVRAVTLTEGNFWGVPELHSEDTENCHIPADKNHHKTE